jgi:hypothetical protein
MSELASNRLAMLAAETRTAHAGVGSAAIARASRALGAGRALIEAKMLLKHGRWLPWLKENCHLPERTAQLYMRLAELELPPELIAALGMEQAAQTEVPIKIMGTRPNYIASYSEPVQRDWLLFALFVRSYEHAEWCMRQSFTSPDEWVGEEGSVYRSRCGMEEPSEGFKAGWTTHQQKHAQTSRATLEAMLNDAVVA